MITRLNRPVTRETALMERGVPYVITIHPLHLELRLKGSHTKHLLAYADLLTLARMRAAAAFRRSQSIKKQ